MSIICSAAQAQYQSWARNICLATIVTTRQRNGASEIQKIMTTVKASKWRSQNEYRHDAIVNSFYSSLKTWSRCRRSVVACPALLNISSRFLGGGQRV